MIKKSFPILALLFLACEGNNGTSPSNTTPQPVKFTTGQAASVVIGQANFNSGGSGTSATTINGPWGSVSVSGGNLYLPDQTNNRVLVYSGIPTANGASAVGVIGQTDLVSSAAGTTSTSFDAPSIISSASNKSIVVDSNNHRVLVYNTSPSSGAAADLVLGQANFTSNTTACTSSQLSFPEGGFISSNKLLVADTNHHRVLVYNSIPTTSGQAADLVLGQTNMTSCADNQGGTATASTLSDPNGIWTDGTKLVIVDSGNHRVLIWNSFPTSNGQAADVVIGQSIFTSSTTNNGGGISGSGFDFPMYVASNGLQLFITDYGNRRLLIWNNIPSTNGVSADVVLGQADFSSNASGDSATEVSRAIGVYLSGQVLVVTDRGNNRVLIYQGTSF